MNAVANPIRTEYCTTEEAARILEVHPSQISRYVGDGRLSAERFGRQLLLLRREVQRFKVPGRGFRSDLQRSGKS